MFLSRNKLTGKLEENLFQCYDIVLNVTEYINVLRRGVTLSGVSMYRYIRLTKGINYTTNNVQEVSVFTPYIRTNHYTGVSRGL